MAPKRIPTRGVEKERYRLYLRKAEEYYQPSARLLQIGLAHGDWNFALLTLAGSGTEDSRSF